MKKAVIDTDCLARVFDENNNEHVQYKPLHDSIFRLRNLKIAYGGKKYNEELKKASRYRKLFSEFYKAGIAILLDDDSVNQYEDELKELTKDTRFNDQHIIAIVIVGRCNIICSRDSNAYPFFQNKELYPKRFRRPSIYNGLGSRSILN